MNSENTDRLVREFPEFFKYAGNLQASLMAFGFEFGDGWFDLTYELFTKIKAEYDTWDKDLQEEFYFVQVKEKYGTARFYTSAATDKVHDLCWEYEEKSATICEVCGKPGATRGGGWIQTLCDEHAEGRREIGTEDVM